MADFKDLKSLFKHIEKDVVESMKNEVAKTVKQVEQMAIQDEVYDVYNVVGGSQKEPYVYDRRREDGGLQDIDNMFEEVEIVNGHVILKVVNKARGQDEPSLYIAPLVEYGDDAGYGEYQYKENRDGTAYQYLQPRPFTRETIERLNLSGAHIDELRHSLKSKGYKIE